MSRQRIEKTGTIQAVDDAGVIHDISIYTTFTEVTSLSEPAQWRPGLKAYKMSNGNHVNVNDDGTFEDIHNSKTLRQI